MLGELSCRPPLFYYALLYISVFFDFRNCTGVPIIFEEPAEKYSAYRIMQILLNCNIDPKRIAKMPLQSPFSSIFLVDLSQLSHPDDVKKDMYGKWLYSGSHSDIFLCSFSSSGQVVVEKAAPGASGDNVYSLRCLQCSS